ncbi:MAG: hypothetical protein AAF492_32855, partial [Verrucomicrobiota bacterium]
MAGNKHAPGSAYRLSWSLLGVFIFAKCWILPWGAVNLTVWTPFVFLWQDLTVVLILCALERSPVSPAPVRLFYGFVSFYTAWNMPLQLAMGTPSTVPLWRSAQAALMDSM